jgi:sulfide:quinone oxidoreductase
MKKLLILGAGTAGTIMANKMFKKLKNDEWEITIVDKDKTHFYQPGFLYIPFGIYTKKDVIKPRKCFITKGVKVIYETTERIDPDKNKVLLRNNEVLYYDILIIATGSKTSPEATPGLKGDQWHKTIFDFYTLEGAEALAIFLQNWRGGNMVVNIADLPVKCPLAPLEFSLFADAFFTKKGIREKVNLSYVTPFSGAFTKPKSSELLGSLLEKKNIKIIPDFFLAEVDNTSKVIKDYGGREIPFDCLVSIPLHSGDRVISDSGLGDEFGFIRTDKKSLQSVNFKNIFVIGDAGNFPISKAGSVAHYQSEILQENILSFIDNKPLSAASDGHANCFIESGFGKGILADYNYETEPLPGFFPFPVIGPFRLLKETRLNHLGKLKFKWIYWNILLWGRKLPLSTKMSMKGKRVE